MISLKISRFVAVSCGSFALFVAACGEESAVVDDPITLEAFAQQHKDATCAYLARCGFFADAASCDASTHHDRRVLRSVAAVTAGSLEFDPLAAKSCLDALGAESCEGEGVVSRSLRETCDAVFTGRAEEGAACFSASECAGFDAVCEGACDESCCEGVCTLAAAALADGAACDGSVPCSDSSHCAYDDMGVGTCKPKIGAGEPCTAPDACTKGNACDPNSGACFKQAATGASCNPNLTADGCAHRNEYCDAASSKCTPLPGPGEPCATNALLVDGACAPYAECRDGNCIARPSEGDACSNGACGADLRGALPSAVRCGDMDTCVARAPEPLCIQ
jgi:hypothetical protein